MKIYSPFKNWFITQKYAENANTYYAEAGRKGHGAFDLVAIGDKTIYAGHQGVVFSIANKDNKDLMRYRCVYTLIEDSGIFYELSYGHCDKIYVKEGQIVERGTALATEGNTGNVASGGKKVTLEEKKKALPNMPGAHLHLQLRLVKPVEKRVRGNQYLQNTHGYYKKDGKYLEIQNYNNGYAGCIDIEPFFVYESAVPKTVVEKIKEVFKPHFSRTLKYGMKGSDVKTLQQYLGIQADGVFGVHTEKAVKDFQKANKLVVDGIAGPKTIGVLIK